MKNPKIFIDQPLEPGETIAVKGEEFHYLLRVRRARVGGHVTLFSKNGIQYSGKLVHVDEHQGEVIVETVLEPAATIWPIHLLVAVPKHHLMDELIRRVSEIGVETLTPLLTERGVQKPGNTRSARWQKIAAESQRQCSRCVPLQLEPPRTFASALARRTPDGTGYICHPSGPGFLAAPSLPVGEISPIYLAIGPEGGFTTAEVEHALSLGYLAVNLGESILRIETAAVVASVLAVAQLGGYSRPEIPEHA